MTGKQAITKRLDDQAEPTLRDVNAQIKTLGQAVDLLARNVETLRSACVGYNATIRELEKRCHREEHLRLDAQRLATQEREMRIDTERILRLVSRGVAPTIEQASVRANAACDLRAE